MPYLLIFPSKFCPSYGRFIVGFFIKRTLKEKLEIKSSNKYTTIYERNNESLNLNKSIVSSKMAKDEYCIKSVVYLQILKIKSGIIFRLNQTLLFKRSFSSLKKVY